jgi:O-antigen/teichoic acid export membrane protein
MSDPENPIDSNTPKGSALAKFVNPGIVLFLDQLIIAVSGGLFWLAISKIVDASDIGHATALYSLVLLVITIIELGLEYPLLKKSIMYRNQTFGTGIVIELVLIAVTIPIVLYLTNSLYQQSQELAWMAVGILIIGPANFVARFSLLGLSNAKSVLILDVIGTVTKFTAGFSLVSAGYGASGILLSFLLQSSVYAGCWMLYLSKKRFGFGLGNISFAKEMIKDGLSNMPSKLSGMLLTSLSVVLLTSFGVGSSEIGMFYIATIISLIASTFGSSLAFMAIPASSAMNKELSLSSLRIGLSFTAPMIAALIVAPASILSILDAEYVRVADSLVILAAGILPSVILSNANSKFNNLNKHKELLAVGSVRLVSFLVAFFVLVPQYGSLGAAYSITVSFISSAVLSLRWFGRDSIRYIAASIFSIFVGVMLGRIIEMFVDHAIAAILISICACFAMIIATKCTDIDEIRNIIATARGISSSSE